MIYKVKKYSLLQPKKDNKGNLIFWQYSETNPGETNLENSRALINSFPPPMTETRLKMENSIL